MLHSEVVQRLMFDYESLSRDEMAQAAVDLPRKVLRWMAASHPDNRTRLLFYELTGVRVGAGTVINPNVLLYDEYAGLVSFGERVSVASGVAFVAASGPNNSRLAKHPYVSTQLVKTAPIFVGDDAWVGAHAVVLPGVTIGARSVVGAGAVVTTDVASDAVVAGVPARLIRSLTQ
jgi:acetyltransferase-like isoleucine patch superfamily enzyme